MADRSRSAGRGPSPEPISGGERDPAARAADHAAIDRLADELLPALSAKLAASSLGEIEIREGDWRIRLRRPADGTIAPPTGRPSGRRRTQLRRRARPCAGGPRGTPRLRPGPRRAGRDRVAGGRRAATGSTATQRPRGTGPIGAVATSPVGGRHLPAPSRLPSGQPGPVGRPARLRRRPRRTPGGRELRSMDRWRAAVTAATRSNTARSPCVPELAIGRRELSGGPGGSQAGGEWRGPGRPRIGFGE
jgi:hypothetical protein